MVQVVFNLITFLDIQEDNKREKDFIKALPGIEC